MDCLELVFSYGRAEVLIRFCAWSIEFKANEPILDQMASTDTIVTRYNACICRDRIDRSDQASDAQLSRGLAIREGG